MTLPKTVLYITGGGTEAIGMLLREGGASAYIEEIKVPYSKESIRQILSYNPPKYACESVARQLAVTAYYRAKELVGNDDIKVVGLGSTAKLKVDNEREGREHSFHIALHTDTETMVRSTKFHNGTRQEQEFENAKAIYRIVHPSHMLEEGNLHLKYDTNIWGATAKVSLHKDTIYYFYNTTPPVHHDSLNILSGSFNPLHEGHINMGRAAFEYNKHPVYYELSIINTSKPSLDHIEINKRIEQFRQYDGQPWFAGVMVTSLPLFIDKAMMLKGATFIVGSDVIRRIFVEHEGYGHGDCTAMKNRLKEAGAKFLYVERKNEPCNIHRIDDILQKLPDDLYQDSGETSSQLRKNQYEWND